MHPRTIDDGHDDFGGLHRDLAATRAAIDRRGLFRLAARFGAGVGALQLIGCASNPTSPSESGGSSTGGGSCSARIPEETQGPFPADGSNGPSVLSLGGVVRSDIRSSFAGLNGTAAGVPLTIELTIVSVSTCSPLAGRAVYIWHCDRAGGYSLYSQGVTNQNYLRGVQEADASGRVSFTSIFPGCYAGTMAAHSLRGVSEPRGGDQRRQPDRHVADRAAEVGLRCGVCDDGLREQHRQPVARVARERHGLQRRLGARARHGERQRRRHSLRL